MDDNQRQAAGLKIGISNYVASAALAVLAGAAGIFMYVSQNFDVSVWFYALMAAVAISLVASIVVGGLGADSTVADLADGGWSNQPTREFDLQAKLTLAGLILVLASTVVGVSADRSGDPTERRVDRLELRVSQLQREAARLRSKVSGAVRAPRRLRNGER